MKIFLSAVSGEFKACRDALASDLRAVGAEVMVQEDFQQSGRTLLEKLEALSRAATASLRWWGTPTAGSPRPKPFRWTNPAAPTPSGNMPSPGANDSPAPKVQAKTSLAI